MLKLIGSSSTVPNPYAARDKKSEVLKPIVDGRHPANQLRLVV